MPSSDWIDITLPLHEGVPHWPDDPPFELRRLADLGAGDALNLSALSLSAHCGTHVDAPLHFIADGASVAELPLTLFMGPARIIAVNHDGGFIRKDVLLAAEIQPGERLLLRTANSDRPEQWARGRFLHDFVALDAEAASYLAALKLRCLGVDYLSVSRLDDDAGAVHRPLLAAGVGIIEGLDLSATPPGEIELCCLPLRIVGADGAPARALVRYVL